MTRQAKQPFKLLHQKLSLTVDLYQKSLVGYTELTILPLKTLYTVTLNSRQSLIKRVLVNNFETKYELKNYLDQIVPPHEGYADSETVRTFYRAAQEASDEGELSITIAEPVADEQAQSVLALTDQQHMPVTLRVYYELRDPSGGAVFVLPDKTAYPTRFAHMYTCNQPGGARTWMPCVDSSGERCAWEIELLVPKHCTAVAPGQLQDQLGVSDESMRSFVYKTAKHEKYSAGSIVLSVGVYETVNDAQWPYITHYCLPNRQRALSHVTSYLPQIIAFYEHYLGNKYPYSSYKQVFVEDAYSSVLSGASLSVLSTHLLHDDKVIDQTFETRRLLALSLAQQWFSHFIAVKSWSDQWLVFGLAGYMSYLFVLKVFGYNEFRYRLVRDVEYITAHAHINQPLYNTNYTSAAELYSKLVFVKSTVTMYLLEKRLGTEGFQKLLSGLVIKNAEGDPPDTTVSTSKFLKLAKKLTGLEMKMFADKWIYGKGSPHLICGFWFNRMKNQTEIAIKQDLHKCEKVTGNITIRIHETDEIDEQQVALEDEVHEVDFICHSKSRRNKRPVPRRAAAPTTTASVGTPVPSESQSVPPPEESAVTMMDLEPAANSSNMAKNAWKHDIPISWIRIDPELHWIRQLSFKQPEFMWINQLENDRDVLAQHEAIQGLAAHPSQNAISALNDVLVNKEMFYRIRMEAAHCMAALTSKETNWLGLDLLIKHFKAAYYYDNLNQLRPNDFSNFSAYFLQRAIAEAVSQVKDEHGRTPSDVIDFLLDLLRNNDNSRNSYSDNYYVASILRALGNTTSTEQQAQERIVKQIERYLDLEKMVPCYHNSITVACLQALMTIYSRQGSVPNFGLFEQYAKYGNFQEVRAIAFEALIRLGVAPNPRSEQASGVLQHVIECIVRDKSPWLRYAALTALLSALDDTVLDLPELRQQVFDCLNSVTLAYDERVRTAMIDLYVRFGGDKFASFRLEPRPKLPYRPLPKKETDKNKKQKKKRKKEDEDVKPPVKPAPAKIKTQPPVTPKSAGVRTNPVTPSVKTPVTPNVKTPVTPAVKPSPPPSAPVTPSPSGGSLRVSIPVTPRTPTPAVAKVTPTTPNPNPTLAPSPTVPQRSPSPTPVAAPVETKPAPRTPLPPTTPPPPRTPTQQTPTQQTPTQQTPTPMMVDLAELTIKLPRALVKATLAELARPTFVPPPTTPLPPRIPTLPTTQPSPNPVLTLPKITIKTDPNKSMTPSQPVNPHPVLQSHAPSVVAPAGGGLKLRVSVGKPQQTSPTSLKLVVNKDANK